MIQLSKCGAWLGAGMVGWLVLAPACSSSNSKKKPTTYVPSDAGQTGEAGTSNSDAGTGPRAGESGLGGAAGELGENSAAGDGAGDGGESAAGSGGEAGGFDADGCGQSTKNCERSNPDCETSVDTVTSCGECDVHCDAVHGTPICEEFKCVVPAGKCEAGYGDCDNDGQNGCETALTSDSNNCGTCGRVCQGNTPCQASQCASVVVVEIGSSIAGEDVHFTANNVFFSSWDKTGTELGFGAREPATFPGTPTWISATTSVQSITGDANFVYFLRDPFGSVHNIRKLAVDGTGLVAQVNEDVANSSYLRSNATAFFMLTPESVPTSIVTLAKNSMGSPVPIVTGRNRIYQMLLTPTKLVWIEGNTPVENPPVQNIYVGPLAGGSGTQIKMIPGDLMWDGDYYKGDMVSDGKYLYWCLDGSGTGKVRRYALDGSGQPEDLAFDLNRPTSLVLDEEYLYFLANNSSLFRLRKEGGVLPELITTNTGYMSYLDLVDDKFVWGHNNNSLGQILRTPK